MLNAILAFLVFLASGIAIAESDTPMVPFKVISSGTLAGGTVTSTPVDVRNYGNIAVQVDMPATSPAAVGLFLVDVSEDYAVNPYNAGNWTTLNFASQGATYANMVVPPTGTPAAVFVSTTPAAVFFRDINQTPAAYMRVRYVPTTTSAGVVSVYMSGK